MPNFLAQIRVRASNRKVDLPLNLDREQAQLHGHLGPQDAFYTWENVLDQKQAISYSRQLSELTDSTT